MQDKTPTPVQGESTVSDEVSFDEVNVTPIPEGNVTTETVPAGYFEHVVTKEDVALNPGEELLEGEIIQIADDSVVAVVQGTVEPEIEDLIKRKENTHRIRVFADKEMDYWEVYIIHRSSTYDDATCRMLRGVEEKNLGYHKIVKGTKAEVLEAVKSV